MNQAIKTLIARITVLNQEIERREKEMEEPEMLCDIEFAMNDLLNFHCEIKELLEAIKILNNHKIENK